MFTFDFQLGQTRLISPTIKETLRLRNDKTFRIVSPLLHSSVEPEIDPIAFVPWLFWTYFFRTVPNIKTTYKQHEKIDTQFLLWFFYKEKGTQFTYDKYSSFFFVCYIIYIYPIFYAVYLTFLVIFFFFLLIIIEPFSALSPVLSRSFSQSCSRSDSFCTERFERSICIAKIYNTALKMEFPYIIFRSAEVRCVILNICKQSI